MLDTEDICKQQHYMNFREDPEIALRRRLEEEKLKRRIGILVAAAENKQGVSNGKRVSSKSEQNPTEQCGNDPVNDNSSSSNAENDVNTSEINQPQHFLLTLPLCNSTSHQSVHPISHHKVNNTRERDSKPPLLSINLPTKDLIPQNNMNLSKNSTKCTPILSKEKTRTRGFASCDTKRETSDQKIPKVPSSQVDTSSPRGQSSISKRSTKSKDRKNLRKGKWTTEEEVFTSRIIHYFSTGLLTLPEGTTLRSYLSEKLSCDPMRITKKFAGASCLGKRVYRLCDRTQATGNDIEMAKAELARLEQRFRARVEQGRTPFFSQDTADNVSSHVSSGLTPQVGVTNWLSQYGSTQSSSMQALPWLFSQTGPLWFNNMSPNPLHMNLPIIPNTLNVNRSPQSSNSLPTTPLTNLAWIQALSTMVPPIHPVVPAFNTVASNISAKTPFQATTITAIDHTQELWKNQQNALAAAEAAEACARDNNNLEGKTSITTSNEIKSTEGVGSSGTLTRDESGDKQTSSFSEEIAPLAPVRSKEEEDAGSMLLGFLSTLRKGHAAAMEEARKSNEIELQKTNLDAISSPGEDEQIKDSSLDSSFQGSSNDTTHPSESSGGNSCDSETSETLSSSDNGNQDRELTKTGSSVTTDNSGGMRKIDDWEECSSDDSEKDQAEATSDLRKGTNVGIFSSKNVADHTTRMNALQKGPSTLESLTCHNRLPVRKRKRKRTEDEK